MNIIFNKYQRNQAIQRIDDIFAKDKKVKIEQLFEIRTLDQNSLYWLWMACISIETGFEKNKLHEYFKQEFIEKENLLMFGKENEVRLSTTELNTKQFTNYLEKINIFCAEWSIILPYPADKDFENFKNTYKDYI